MVATAQPQVKLLSVCDHVAPVDAWQKALERAKAEGVKVYHRNGEWLASSVSRPGTYHRVNGSCDCEAGQHGRICKHVASVRSAQLKAGVLAICTLCGRVQPTDTMHFERIHVGGIGDVPGYFCTGRHLLN